MCCSAGATRRSFKLATNTRARFSQTGYGILVDDAEGDDRLTETVALRFDIPQRLLRELLERATEAVRSRILALAPPETRDDIQRVVADIAKSVGNAVVTPRDFSDAERVIAAMEAGGKLDETALLDFVNQRKYEEMTVALTRLCSASLKLVSGLMMGLRNDALLVLPGGRSEMADRGGHSAQQAFQPQDIGQVIQLARGDYERLSVATARRTLRFMQVREAANTPKQHPNSIQTAGSSAYTQEYRASLTCCHHPAESAFNSTIRTLWRARPEIGGVATHQGRNRRVRTEEPHGTHPGDR